MAVETDETQAAGGQSDPASPPKAASDIGRLPLTRRKLLIGGAVGGGLIAGWALWPDNDMADLPAAENERAFGLWLKIATSGQVTLNVAQSEMGQGVMTMLAEAAAHELGADWRTMAIQPVARAHAFANMLLAEEWGQARVGGLLDGDGWARDLPFIATGGSTSIRMFAPLVREAAAAARSMLIKAAARRWNAEGKKVAGKDIDWEKLDSRAGFVVDPADKSGKLRLAFADLVDAAARENPGELPLRKPPQNNGAAEQVVRLDMPSKLDGSANFAADIRLPGMVFASLRSAPLGATLKEIDEEALSRRPNIAGAHVDERWFAVAANNWWAADQALGVAKPVWTKGDAMPDDKSIDAALVDALGGDGVRIVSEGEVEPAFADQGNRVFIETVRARPAVHVPAETRAVAARIDNGRAEIWLATQAPEDARTRVARALDMAVGDVVIYPMLAGGSFGRNFDNEIAAMAAKIARTLDRPVSLMLSREEDMRIHAFRPPALGHIKGALGSDGLLKALSVKVAMPAFMVETMARIVDGADGPAAQAAASGQSDPVAMRGAVPPYQIANMEVAHFPADVGLPSGRFRGNSHNIGTFFIENFIDLCATQADGEPLSYRMGMLRGQLRLARCLTRVAEMARWNGGIETEDGGAMGLACTAMRGSHIAVIAIAEPGESGMRVRRLFACVDAGRLINADIARQQIQGALIFGAGQAFGNAVHFEAGRPRERRLERLRLPLYATSPEVQVEFIDSDEDPGGIGEIGVPAVAPAIAAALHRIDGERRWTLPFS